MKVLICDPDLSGAKDIQSYFVGINWDFDSVNNGKDCQLKIYKAEIDALILDLDTKNHSGLEVLRYMRLNHSQVKIILTAMNQKTLDALELTKDDLRKLGASDIIIKPYKAEKLHKSLQGNQQFESWKDVKDTNQSRSEESIRANDDEFTRIKIENFTSGNTTIFDHFIRLGPDNYVKILHKGDFFAPAQLRKYKEEKNVEFLYFRTKDRAAYINFINKLVEKSIASGKGNTEAKVQTTKLLTEKYIEEIYTSGVNPGIAEEGKKLCNNMYQMVQRDKDLMRVLLEYEDYDPPAHTHLFLVSFFSVIICKNLDWATQRTVEMVGMGSLFHDIGMLKMPQLRNKYEEEMTEQELSLYHTHPKLGVEMLQKNPLVGAPVLQIIYQHHELVNGTGFPNGLRGNHIYPLAKVVALSDAFCHLIMKKKLTPLAGLKELIPNREMTDCFDPILIKALIKGFIK